jgi:hypothetical protein
MAAHEELRRPVFGIHVYNRHHNDHSLGWRMLRFARLSMAMNVVNVIMPAVKKETRQVV